MPSDPTPVQIDLTPRFQKDLCTLAKRYRRIRNDNDSDSIWNNQMLDHILHERELPNSGKRNQRCGIADNVSHALPIRQGQLDPLQGQTHRSQRPQCPVESGDP